MTSVGSIASNSPQMAALRQLEQQQYLKAAQTTVVRKVFEDALDRFEAGLGMKPQAAAAAPAKKKKKKKGFGAKLKKAFKKVARGIGKVLKPLAKTVLGLASTWLKAIPIVGPLAGGVVDLVAAQIDKKKQQRSADVGGFVDSAGAQQLRAFLQQQQRALPFLTPPPLP